ncbi:MAG: hypothetical protein DRJ05_09050 [Bacteroidetes bacterium]|nr:MAG: hypothetical protein DRJ05_09050 [Bacteroidota bacterium]
MKRPILIVLCLMLTNISLFAQKNLITLTFSGVNSNNQTVSIDSVLVENVTQAHGETIYHPNLSITLEYEAGIGEKYVDIFKGSLVYPNPFHDFSIISVNNPEKQEVSISVIDIGGRVICETGIILNKGIHDFLLKTPNPGSYSIIISNGKQKSVLKAISLRGNSSKTTLEYIGQGTLKITGNKSTSSITSFPYQQGDVLQFTGYTQGYPNISITDSPTNTKNYKFEFSQFFRLSEQLVETETPCFVNIMFQVTDENHVGVDNLTTENFIVKEDNQLVSPTEAFIYINKMESIPYRMKTVLLLDNSASTTPNLQEIRNAAISFVNNIVDKQEVAIFTFSDEITLLIDFTDNMNDLVSSIESIQPGYPSTDLYGSIIEAVSIWDDFYSIDLIQQGFLITLTDGDDTQGSYTLNQALGAIGNKRVYMIGLGNEINPDALEELANPGPFFNPNQANELVEIFDKIQNDIVIFGNSFYWLNYMSPKREDSHSLNLEVIDNENTGNDSFISSNFYAGDFYSVYSGVYINTSDEFPYGNDTILISDNDTMQLKAVTYWAYEAPVYEWETSNPEIIEILYDELDDSKISIYEHGNSQEYSIITLSDITNSYTNSVYIIIGSPDTDFIAESTIGNAPTTIVFTDLSTNNPTNWLWNFGDDETSNEQNPEHPYEAPGIYTVSLTASNSYGVDQETKIDYITITGIPVADFEVDLIAGNAPLLVNFSDLSINNPTNWNWDFGDGETSNEQSPEHTYENAGIYTVSLTASNSYGSNQEIKIDYIIVTGIPEADFEANPTEGNVPLLVSFSDLSINNPTSWQWDFGDGNTSNEQNPIHIYEFAGLYPVSLTASNSYGSGDITKIDFITVSAQPCPGTPTVTDIDGNVYNTILVGEQCWMAENLNTTNDANGNSIDRLCYDNSDIRCEQYGGLYSWYTLMNGAESSNTNPSGVQGICPDGWHMPSISEWDEMTDFLINNYSWVYETNIANKLKSCRQENSPLGGECNTNEHPFWQQYNSQTYGTDDFGFRGLAGGVYYGQFSGINSIGIWWSATEASFSTACRRYFSHYDGYIEEYTIEKTWGQSVRCVKD